jgi:hypothetical protein
MEKQSRVKSQITDKVYEVSLDDLDEDDDAFDSELYRIDVFGKNVIIAPGRPIKDKRIQGLVYFYVYVIKNEKAIAKLGVYEITTSENREIYDLTTFPDGALLMFDVYYNKPLLINEFEETESTNKASSVVGINIFDYLTEYVVPETNVVSKIKEQNRRITSLKISCTTYYNKIGKTALGTEYKELLNNFKDKVIDKALLKSLKTINPEHFMFILYTLELFLNVRFIYIDTENTILSDAEYKKNIKMPPTIASNIVVVRLGQMPSLVKVYEPDTPREIIEEEIAALSPSEPEEKVEEVEDEEELDEEVEEKPKTLNPLNRPKLRIGTSLNVKPDEDIEGHTPEFGEPNTYENVPYQLPKMTPYEPVKPKEYSPHSPNFGPAKSNNDTKLNNESSNSSREPSVNLNKVTPLNLDKSSDSNNSNVEPNTTPSSTNSNNSSTSTKLSMLGGKIKVKKSNK